MEQTQKDLILNFVFGDEQPTKEAINECLNIFNESTEKMEQNILTKVDKSFKVHNTWGLLDTWNEGGKEKFYNKILKDLKSTLKEGTDLGRVKKSYIDYTDGTACWFCYETKDYTVKVSLYACKNINGGTWFNIDEIKIVKNNLVESN